MEAARSEHKMASSAITAEDLEFERQLQAAEADMPGIEQGPNTVLRKEKVYPKLLSEHIDDYEPAKTHMDLIEQVHMAKQLGCDSVEATPQVIRQLTLKSGYPDKEGYLWFSDVRVWIPGAYEPDGDKMSVDAKIFANSKVGGIMPIMDMGEKRK